MAVLVSVDGSMSRSFSDKRETEQALDKANKERAATDKFPS